MLVESYQDFLLSKCNEICFQKFILSLDLRNICSLCKGQTPIVISDILERIGHVARMAVSGYRG